MHTLTLYRHNSFSFIVVTKHTHTSTTTQQPHQRVADQITVQQHSSND